MSKGQRQGKGFVIWPSAKRAAELLSLSINYLRIVIGLRTEHCHVKGRVYKMGLVDSPVCVTGANKNLKRHHVFFVTVEALAWLRFRRLGNHFLKRVDFSDISISKVLHFVQSAGLLNA
jgi:hypothetical protein